MALSLSDSRPRKELALLNESRASRVASVSPNWIGLNERGHAPAAILCSLLLILGTPVIALQFLEEDGSDNSIPSVNVPNYPAVTVRQNTTFTAACTELDADDQLRLTWLWGDESLTVTDCQSTGGTFDTTAVHRYNMLGVHELKVWIDDRTGYPDHNVSCTAIVGVSSCCNHAPVIESFVADSSTTIVGNAVNFTAIATDPDSLEILGLSLDFGDGMYQFVNLTQGTPWIVGHYYATWGTYGILLTVTDYQAVPKQSIIVVDIVPVSFALNLAPGWNMVTVPLTGWGYTSSTLGLTFSDVIVRWNSTTQTYGESFIVGISPPSWAFPIVAGEGYWIFTGVAKSLTLYGAIPSVTQYIQCEVSGVGMGWTMIGFLGINEDRHASDIPLMYSVPGAVKMVCRWNTGYGVYQSYIVEFPMTDFLLVPGHAYWVWCNESGFFSYIP